jgi:hypothetical protein
VLTKHGDYKGGYYPIKYDPLRSSRAEADTQPRCSARWSAASTCARRRAAVTSKSASSPPAARCATTSASSPQHVDQVIHDLAWHEWLIDANRLLRSGAIDGAIRDHYGPEKLRAMKDTLRDIAVGDIGAQTAPATRY